MFSRYQQLQETEIRTLHYLGTTSEVIERKPKLKVKVSLCTKNFDGKFEGASCKLIFTCPDNYPEKRPTVDIVEKKNFPEGFEQKLRHEFKRTLDEHEGLQQMMPIITRTQVLMNSLTSSIKFQE